MNEFAKVGTGPMAALIVGLIIWFAVPLALAIFWVVKKKDKFTTVLVGALVFVVFVSVCWPSRASFRELRKPAGKQ